MKLALASGRMGAWDWHIASARVSWSPELERIHGIAEGSFGGTFEAFQEDIHPEDKERVLATIQGAAVEKRRTDFNLMYRIVRSDGQVRWVESRGQLLFDARGQPERMTGVCTDITERKGAEESAQRLLVEQAARAEAVAAQQELSRSNAELQQFAYVASHDLQEPLRAVASYTQLLAKRYKGRLDADADEFIQFILDGTARMQGLIRDLLSYSRVGTGAKTPAVIPCERPLAAAIANLKVGIEQSGAEISHGPLPAVIGEEGQLVQLFQNLLANAIKFRRGPKPRIRVTAHPREGDWELQVKDDGIGISAEYFDRIFIIFQRLHSQAEYAGNGIGLAICKKIVERHGGKIWIESQPNQGTTFHFTLPSGGV
jgi:PAS domain S-box-containing protein